MAWFILIGSGMLEAVWATALGMSDGLSRPVPAVVFFLALAASMGGLARATRSIRSGRPTPCGSGWAPR